MPGAWAYGFPSGIVWDNPTEDFFIVERRMLLPDHGAAGLILRKDAEMSFSG